MLETVVVGRIRVLENICRCIVSLQARGSRIKALLAGISSARLRGKGRTRTCYAASRATAEISYDINATVGRIADECPREHVTISVCNYVKLHRRGGVRTRCNSNISSSPMHPSIANARETNATLSRLVKSGRNT